MQGNKIKINLKALIGSSCAAAAAAATTPAVTVLRRRKQAAAAAEAQLSRPEISNNRKQTLQLLIL